MAIALRQELRLTQQLVMTPQLQQAIKLLQLSRLELLTTVQQELQENPVLEEGLEAASAIGDDRLQKQSRGYVTPESFTHGTSAQRVRWFKAGLEQGSMAACNTFASANP